MRTGRRKTLAVMLGSVFAGASKAKRKHVTLDVVLFSYLSRPIIDVYLNRTRLGLAGPYPFSGNGTITGVDVQLGSQELRWRLDGPKGMPGNGDRIKPINTVSLDEVPAEALPWRPYLSRLHGGAGVLQVFPGVERAGRGIRPGMAEESR